MTSTTITSSAWIGKVLIYIGFPLAGGLFGLGMSYLQTFSKPDHTISFHQDFVFPFLLTIVLVVVVGIRTSNYRSKEMKPIVSFPIGKHGTRKPKVEVPRRKED